MRLGVPFIVPRQLGAVESNLGRQFLPSVVWRTGQSGAHWTLSGARFLSLNGEADRWQPESRWRTGHVRCTPDSPVPPSSRWLGHVSRADRAADRWPCRPSAAPVKERNRAPDSVRCAPDCPVRHATEGKNCLPRLLSTAPSCLGAIKGTPRRMEENIKHSYNIPKHQDIDSAPLILCDSN